VRSPSPNQGELFWDPETDDLESAAGKDLAAFVEATRQGQRAAWLGEYFPPKSGARVTKDRVPNSLDDLSDVEVFFDILARRKLNLGRQIIRCPTCGRLYVQKALFSNEWQSFKPEEGMK
jgi:hypothetical protein